MINGVLRSSIACITCVFLEETTVAHPQFFPSQKEQQIDNERMLVGLETWDELRLEVDFSIRNEQSNSSYAKYVSAPGVDMYATAETEEEAKPYITEFTKCKP